MNLANGERWVPCLLRTTGDSECEQAGFPLLFFPYQHTEKSPLAQNEEQSGLLPPYKRQYLTVFGSVAGSSRHFTSITTPSR